jgi:pilus assembly protein CpaB
MSQQAGGRGKAAVFLVLALGVASLASLAVYEVLQESRRQLEAAQAPPETFPVVVATRDLAMGVPIGLEDVVVRTVLPDMIPPSATFASLEEVVGRTPRERVLGNEMIRMERLARRDAGIGLNALITPGKRAMSVTTNVSTSVAGFIRPGNFVDVLVSIAPDLEELEAEFITQTILQQVKVLAVGATLEREDPEKKAPTGTHQNSLTVELSLEEAERLALADSKGTLYVVLRSDVDIGMEVDDRVTDMGSVLQIEPKVKPPVRHVPIRVVPPSPPEHPLPEIIWGEHRKSIDLGVEQRAL